VLSASADAKGRPLEVIKLPLPPVLHFTEEEARGVKARPRPARPEAGQ
jgi:agmatine deiminase